MTTEQRLILSRKATTLWHHVNPEIAAWGRQRAFAEADKLHADGIECVKVYDADEGYLFHSRGGEEWDRLVEESDNPGGGKATGG